MPVDAQARLWNKFLIGVEIDHMETCIEVQVFSEVVFRLRIYLIGHGLAFTIDKEISLIVFSHIGIIGYVELIVHTTDDDARSIGMLGAEFVIQIGRQRGSGIDFCLIGDWNFLKTEPVIIVFIPIIGGRKGKRGEYISLFIQEYSMVHTRGAQAIADVVLIAVHIGFPFAGICFHVAFYSTRAIDAPEREYSCFFC